MGVLMIPAPAGAVENREDTGLVAVIGWERPCAGGLNLVQPHQGCGGARHRTTQLVSVFQNNLKSSPINSGAAEFSMFSLIRF